MIDWGQVDKKEMREARAAALARAADKARRQTAVDQIVVVIDGLPFQGDELSQGRMLRRADSLVGDETVDWVLADNTVVPITSRQLRAAVRAAVDEMSRLWLETTVGE